MKQQIIALGGGGHFRSCADVITEHGIFSIAGIVDKENSSNAIAIAYPILGTDADIPLLVSKFKNVIITLGHMPKSLRRIALYELCKQYNAVLPVIISPRAYVSQSAVLQEGTIVFHSAVVNAQATIGVCTIINTQALVEHDSHIGNHCHLSTGTLINGGVTIGNNCFIGSGAIIRDNCTIVADTVIGAGAVVVKDINEAGVYIGNPARRQA
jgi:sugar O-acyltransferase (sialic acid O-acetyltransferase NeuD family)